MTNPIRGAAFTASALLICISASAHHSFAMFDMTKTVTLHGTVKEFQWTNPHCFIQLLVPAADATVEWSIELNSPGAQYRGGWRPGTLKPGDVITVVIHPTKASSAAGSLVSAIDATGHTLK
jgi:Family of unknown function (DUF6152)